MRARACSWCATARNQVEEIGETMKRLHHGGVNMKGVLLTDVPQSKMLSG